MADRKIIERIKALLAKAKSTTHEAEAEAFASKVKELLEREQLSLDDLDDAEDEIRYDQCAYEQKESNYAWIKELFGATARFYGCKVAYGWKGGPWNDQREDFDNWDTVELIGRDSAIITAQLMHPYLVKAVRKKARELHEQMGQSVNGAARSIGAALIRRLRQLAPPFESAKTEAGKGLIKLNRMVALEREHWPDLGKASRGATKTNRLAMDAAAKIGLHRQTGQEEVHQLGQQEEE